jgi:hypothetical protein
MQYAEGISQTSSGTVVKVTARTLELEAERQTVCARPHGAPELAQVWSAGLIAYSLSLIGIGGLFTVVRHRLITPTELLHFLHELLILLLYFQSPGVSQIFEVNRTFHFHTTHKTGNLQVQCLPKQTLAIFTSRSFSQSKTMCA